MVLGRSACLRYAKVQDLIHEFVNQHEVVFDAELAELAAEVRSEQCHNLRHGERESVSREDCLSVLTGGLQLSRLVFLEPLPQVQCRLIMPIIAVTWPVL